MMAWVRRSPTEAWHLLESTPPRESSHSVTACGITLEHAVALARLDNANPRHDERCDRCQRAYEGELRGS